MDDRVGALGRVDNLRRTLVKHRVIVRFHPDPNYFLRSCHELIFPLVVPREAHRRKKPSSGNHRQLSNSSAKATKTRLVTASFCKTVTQKHANDPPHRFMGNLE